MAGIVAASAKPPKVGPKVLSHIEIHPKLGGGHIVKHVFSGYQHDPREFQFGADEGDRAAAHIARHTNLPLNGRAEDEPDDEATGNAEKQTAKELPAVRGVGSMHKNARAARTEGVPS
jgi:hypothetical protein